MGNGRRPAVDAGQRLVLRRGNARFPTRWTGCGSSDCCPGSDRPALACSYAGIGLIVMCWVLIGRLAAPGRVRRLSRSQLSHTLAMWAVPLLVTPALFSRDVYSYLAIGSMMNNGFNPYEAGPYDTLGDADPFAHQVDVRWQHTASPYGPGLPADRQGRRPGDRRERHRRQHCCNGSSSWSGWR